MLRPLLRSFFRLTTSRGVGKEVQKRLLSSSTSRPASITKITLVSASVGVLVGAGYGGYTHFQVNKKKGLKPVETDDYTFLEKAPDYKPTFKINSDNDTSNLQLVLFQYRTCPFCCKVRSYLDYNGISYDVVEVDAVLRQDIKWSGYKKVPILLAKVDGGYQQLLDSSTIISVLETYMCDKSNDLRTLLQFYPVNTYTNEENKKVTEVMNKYFIMHKDTVSEKQRKIEEEERKWRQWADSVLVHLLSPNVYRTMNEAYQAFNWFADIGQWWDNFPAWECYVMINVGACAMWIISKRLKKRHNIEDERQSLYDAANKWMETLKSKGTKFLGGNKPNLADLSVYGVLSSIEGCDAFVDLNRNTDIGKWYQAMTKAIESKKGKAVRVAAA